MLFENYKVCIKGEDNTTHHPYHNLEWDIPPGGLLIPDGWG